MAWDGNGNFSRTHNWASDRDAGIKITASRHDAEDDNLATGIGATLTKNNETKPTADFRPNATRLYSLGSTALRWVSAFISASIKFRSATASYDTILAATDATTADKTITLPDATGTVILSNQTQNYAVASGTDTYTATLSPVPTEYTTGADYHITFTNANTSTTPTLNLNSLGAVTIVKEGSAALVAGDIPAGHAAILRKTASNFVLLNPKPSPLPHHMTLATQQATTSGTSIDFTGIPTGTKRIIIMFDGVSTNGSSGIGVRLGDSGGIESTSYTSSASRLSGGSNAELTDTSSFVINAASTDLLYGQMTLVLKNSATFAWSSYHVIGGDSAVFVGGGAKSLSAELDRIRIISINGTDAFDAGSINISYE